MRVLEFTPLVVFFVLYKFYGVIHATSGIVVTTLLATVINFLITKQRPNNFVLASTALMILMGSLTVFTSNSAFIKVKPTILYSLCGLTITGGLLMRKVFIKSLFSAFLFLNDRQWRVFSIQWVAFFLVAAISNEIIWRFFSEETWVNFKVIFMPLFTLLFMFLQILLYRKHLVIQNDK
ncbi:MAG: inner membrane-spanning protein YciB [Candidatus Midichloria sp.]|uniref:Septation protein A n=1 Tax=Hyalomma marginatum TaxID=34627 RepID=A0A8S4BUU8_9ACAR|nr:septation protein A [Hyalomma marginatum]CAG7592374.1 septation protein A [Hyalomma marginatum]